MKDGKQPLTEQESLKLITEMIHTAKSSFHEDGTSAILWGSVVGVCGIVSFLENYFKWSLGFDIWTLALIAIIPQVYISIKEKKQRVVKTYTEAYMGAIWLVYGISLFALVFYFNVIANVANDALLAKGQTLFIQSADGSMQQTKPFPPSYASLLILIYGIPTLTTGIARKFKPMIYGGALCYGLFVLSCYTNSSIDLLLNGIAGIFNWLIPGIILRKRFYANRTKQ